MSFIEFQKTISKELDIVKNRVRYLIDDANWAEEGRYKEAILKGVIKRFLPDNLSIGTGFICKINDIHSKEISKQIDLIIYDNTSPVLFKEGDFIVTTEKNVRGIIEVKSTIDIPKLRLVQAFFNDLDRFRSISKNKKIFKGLFSYNNLINATNNENLEEILIQLKDKINHLSLDKDKFIRYWPAGSGEKLYPRVEHQGAFFNVYNIPDLSFSYFISNCVHMVCDGKLNDRYGFSFPIPDTKEVGRVKTIIL
jgi:hypothetical protein